MKKIFSILGGIGFLALSTISCTFAYTQEQHDAYQWAYKYGITTQPTIEAANLDGNLTRQAFAKMVVNYLEKAVGIQQNNSNSCTFPDENKFTNELKYYAKKTCAYQIMGENGTNFNPTNIVNRAQLGTVLSRILWGGEHNASGKDYYIYHLNALKFNGIMNKIDNPQTYAKRGDVLIMLKRIYDKYGSNIYMNGNQDSSYDTVINNITTNDDKTGGIVDYNNTLLEYVRECTYDKDSNLNDIIKDNNSTKEEINNAIEDSISTCENSINKINKMGGWNGDNSLKDASIKGIKNHVKYLGVLTKMVPYRYIDNMTNEEKAEYDKLFNEANSIGEESLALGKELQNIQETFAKKHELELKKHTNEKKINNEEQMKNEEKINNDENEFSLNYNVNKVIYTGKDGTTYNYNTGFINILIKTADKKGETNLSDFLKIESDFFGGGLEMANNFDEEEFAKELGIDLDNLNENMSKKEKEELADKFGIWVNKMINENKDRNNKFIKDLKKIIDKIGKDDKFGLQEKYEKSKDYIEAANSFLEIYGELITNLVKASMTMEEGDDNEEVMGQAFGLLGMAFAFESTMEEYQNYLDNWGINTIKLFGGELIE